MVPGNLAPAYLHNWGIPRNLTITISGSNVVLNWSSPSDSNNLDGYIVYRNGNIYDYTPNTHYTVPLNGQSNAFYQVTASFHDY
jgi:hypothetical protein